jgi:zinc protease
LVYKDLREIGNMRVLCLGAAFLVLPLMSEASEPKVVEARLENGLKILIQEDHRAPVVVSQVWYKVGASSEYAGVTGVSHMLEHMMFKGTAKHPGGDFSKIVAANGGRENAFTSQDYTTYFQMLERSKLPVSLELEADRMRNLRFSEIEYEKEHAVVLEERRLRTDDQPHAKLQEHFDAVAYTNSPYRNPVIGWPDDIGHLTLSAVREWYQRWYAPNNATLVVVGDVRPEDVIREAKKHFGSLKPSVLPPPRFEGEVDQLGLRRMTVRLPAKLPHLLMGFKVPSLKTVEDDKEAYALEVAAGILDGGNSARFARHLVRGQQVAASTGVGYDLYARLHNLFMIEGTPAQGQTVEALESALMDQVKRLREEPVGEDELQRVKAQVLANHVYQLDSAFYQAMQLGTAETVGLGWGKVAEYESRVNQVSAADIQAVVRKYLIEDRLTIARLDPLPLPEGASKPEASAIGGGHVR